MPTKTFSSSLLRWYRASARSLPWRKTRDPYRIWISEIMLQQTTVAAVIPYYKKWIKQFPKIENVAQAKEQTVLKAWQGLGYYTRARNIKKCAEIVCKDYNKKLPADPEQLKKLPGFGPYTVGAVASIAFNIRHPIIDANVRRVIMRILAIKGEANTKVDNDIYAYLDKVLPKRCVGDFNQALMELGALVCRKKEPVCLSCPVKSFCKAYAKGIQELIPEAKVKSIKEVDAAIAVINKGKKILIQQRPSKGLLAGLWEFPGGKIEKGETVKKALKREIVEEIGGQLTDSNFLMNVTHYYTQFKVNLHVYTCQLENYTSLKCNGAHKWVGLKELTNYPMPSGSAKIVEKLTQ